MTTPLLPAERAGYTATIDSILAAADLQTISSKQIRKELVKEFGVELGDKKAAVNELIGQRFDLAHKAIDVPVLSTEGEGGNKDGDGGVDGGGEKEEKEKAKANGYHTPSRSTSAISTPFIKEASDSDEPPTKKRKATSGAGGSGSGVKKEVDDAKLAARLQAQEDRGARPTRRGVATPKRKRVVKKKQKSDKKVKDEDDSEGVVSDGVVREKVKKGGFHVSFPKQYHLSAPLADLVGEPTLSRPQVVKKLWEYIKGNDLQDPADKRQILCDDKLQLVFKQDKVHMFTMNKLLGKQLYDVEEE
ncbi:Upstream activation factor subunit [Lachnellula occidentalis]|uniref:Upstream activation factor subunit n=1 Tax=Lachnellula occidentalis TaxID=215460 RepID=A0A8H8UDQ9_9HELO|nr:Upstream activation factor subunit [Lachnellula occidentalis]